MTHPIPEAALSQHILIVGMVGAGKTFTAKGVVERLIRDGRRTCIVDVIGVWYGLRLGCDGGGGLPLLILGGEHADIEVTEDMGTAVATLIADPAGPSALLDLSQMTGAAMRRFMTAFAAELYRLNRAPLHLIIDEADEMMPQQPMPDAMRLLGELDRIVRRGRARGFRVTMITQRPAVLHKNVVTQAATLVAMRLVSEQDRKAIEGWIKGVADTALGKKVLSALPGLDTGEGFVWSPQAGVLEKVRFPEITTLDTSRTPEHGEDALLLTDKAGLDVGAIAARLSALAGEKAQDAKPQKRPVRDDREHQAARKDAHAAGWKVGYADGLASAAASVRELLRQLEEPKDDRHLEVARQIQAMPIPDAEREPARTILQSSRPAPASTEGKRPSGVQRMLNVLVSRHPAKLTRAQLGTLAGLKSNTGSFGNNLGALRRDGYMLEAGQECWASPKAVEEFGAAVAPVTPEEVRAMWRSAIGGGGVQRMFDHLVDIYPADITRTALAFACGLQPNTGSYGNNLGTLRRNNLIVEDRARSTLRLSADLFDGDA
jgi:hypothetical protein